MRLIFVVLFMLLSLFALLVLVRSCDSQRIGAIYMEQLAEQQELATKAKIKAEADKKAEAAQLEAHRKAEAEAAQLEATEQLKQRLSDAAEHWVWQQESPVVPKYSWEKLTVDSHGGAHLTYVFTEWNGNVAKTAYCYLPRSKRQSPRCSWNKQ